MSCEPAKLFKLAGGTLKEGSVADITIMDLNKKWTVDGQSSKEERGTMMNKAINKDLAYMHTVLNEEQYKKYVMLLNATMANRGLK